jgi:phage terminase large subunit
VVAVAVDRRDTETVEYWPRGASADLFKHHEPECVISGPAGTGKTYGALWRLHLAALKYPGMRGIMVRKVGEDLTASALVTYQSRILGAGNWNVRPYGGSKLKPASFQYPNGAELLIGGLDKPQKVMSREYDLVYVNEVTELTEEDWENLTTRARWGVMPYQQVFGDCNPGPPGHWLHKRYKAKKTTMLFSVHEDNPALYDARTGRWTEQGAAYIAKLDNLTGFRRDRLRLGLWTAAEGAVYPMFTEQTHVARVDCAGWGTIQAIDLGTRNPTVILTIRYSSDRIHVEREVYQRGLSSDSITDYAVSEAAHAAPEFVVVDPSAAGLIGSLEERGFAVVKAVNDVKVGISRVTSVMGSLTVDPSCVNTIEEFQGYRYSDRALDNDVPVKANDHAMDALRYGVMQLFAPTEEEGVLFYDEPVTISVV